MSRNNIDATIEFYDSIYESLDCKIERKETPAFKTKHETFKELKTNEERYEFSEWINAQRFEMKNRLIRLSEKDSIIDFVIFNYEIMNDCYNGEVF